MKTYPIRFVVLVALSSFTSGALLIYVLTFAGGSQSQRGADIFSTLGSDGWTNPLLACADLSELSQGKIKEVKTDLERLIATRTADGELIHASVYVRDLNNGPWFDINPDTLFYPASLLKVPILITAYKMEEDHPGFLEKEAVYSKPAMGEIVQLFPPKETLQVGTTYTLRELVRRMIVYSDNEAMNLLSSYVDPSLSLDIFAYFGIEPPNEQNQFRIKVSTYASFFRVLYNASFLNRNDSEAALKLLSETEFSEGLKAGLPLGVPVAHKFGERRYVNALGVQEGSMQLHDCGIVYAENPYVICILVEGRDIDSIARAIADMSKIVYDALGRKE